MLLYCRHRRRPPLLLLLVLLCPAQHPAKSYSVVAAVLVVAAAVRFAVRGHWHGIVGGDAIDGGDESPIANDSTRHLAIDTIAAHGTEKSLMLLSRLVNGTTCQWLSVAKFHETYHY